MIAVRGKITMTPIGVVETTSKKVPDNVYRKETSMRSRMLFLIVTLVTVFGGVASANASLSSVLPNGLSTHAQTAKSRVQSLVSNDAGVQTAIARDTGLSTDDVANSTVTNIRGGSCVVGSSNCINTGRDGSGNIIPTSAHNGQKVFTWVTTFRVNAYMTFVARFKYDCSNPLLRKVTGHVRLLVVVKKVHFRMKFHKSKTTAKTITCPSGQQVFVQVVTTVQGSVYVTSLTKGVKLISQKLTAKMVEDIRNVITVKCGEMPPPPPTPGCAAGDIQDSNGNCVSQQANCENNLHGNWDQQNQMCTIVQNNCGDVVIVYGNGNTVYQQGNNCNSSPPPSCQETNTCPPPPADHAPVVWCVWPAHVFVGGMDVIYCEAQDTDGDAIALNIVGDSFAHVSGTVPVDYQWDNSPCPAGWTCYKANLWGDQVGTAHIVATATANGKSSDPSVGDVPVKQDQF